MIDKIKEQITKVEAFTTTNIDEIEAFRIKYLGKKGILNGFSPSSKTFRTNKKENSDKP